MLPKKTKQSQGQKDLDWALGLNRMGAQLLGVWPSKEHIESEPWHVKFRVPVIIIATVVAVLLPQIYAISKVINDLPLIIDNLMTNVASCTACFKYFFLWRNKRVLWPVIEAATNDWLRHSADEPLKRRVMLKHAANARYFTVAGYFVLLGCYAGFTVAPLLGLDIRMINNITDYALGRKLVVQSYFPFDYYRSPYFELLHGCQLFAGFFMAMSISMPDNYFGALVFHLSAQFEILADRIERLAQGHGDDPQDRLMSRRRFATIVKLFVDRHVHLLSMVTAVERSFCYVMMAQVFNTSLMLCCVGFQILGIIGSSDTKPSYFQLVTLLGVICALMMHTLVDCYASETLAFQSTELFHSIYKSKWYAVSPNVPLRDLIPMMLVSKFARQMTGGKIFNLSLATYCNILKSSAGYISMLIAVSRRR